MPRASRSLGLTRPGHGALLSVSPAKEAMETIVQSVGSYMQVPTFYTHACDARKSPQVARSGIPNPIPLGLGRLAAGPQYGLGCTHLPNCWQFATHSLLWCRPRVAPSRQGDSASQLRWPLRQMIDSRYGRITRPIRQTCAARVTSAGVTLPSSRAFLSASIATSTPSRLRNLKQSAIVFATL